MVNRQKVLGILKKTSFLLSVTNFCWNSVQSWSKPKILDKMQSIKYNWKTKMNNIVHLGCLFSKLPRIFVNFSSAIVSIFYRGYCPEPSTDFHKLLKNKFDSPLVQIVNFWGVCKWQSSLDFVFCPRVFETKKSNPGIFRISKL